MAVEAVVGGVIWIMLESAINPIEKGTITYTGGTGGTAYLTKGGAGGAGYYSIGEASSGTYQPIK